MMSEKHLTLDQVNSRFKSKGYDFVSLVEDKSGFINKTIFLKEGSGKEYVLRLCSNLDTFKREKTLSEVRAIKFANEIGTVPAPTIYDYDPTTENEFECEYILMSKLDGEQLSKVIDDMQTDQVETVMRELVAMFKPVWAKRFEKIGPLDDEGQPGKVLFESKDGPYSTRLQYLTSAVYSIIETSGAKGSKNEDLILKLRDAILAKPEVPAAFFCFAHFDLKFDNLLFHKGHISGVVDWEWSGALPFETEIFNTDFYRLDKYRDQFLNVLNEKMGFDVRRAMDDAWDYNTLFLGSLVLLWYKMWNLTEKDPLVAQWVAELENLMRKYGIFDGMLIPRSE